MAIRRASSGLARVLAMYGTTAASSTATERTYGGREGGREGGRGFKNMNNSAVNKLCFSQGNILPREVLP